MSRKTKQTYWWILNMNFQNMKLLKIKKKKYNQICVNNIDILYCV